MAQATEAAPMVVSRDTVLQALEVFARQRPGIDARDYGGGVEGFRAYQAECRQVTRDLADVRRLLAAVRWRSGISGAALLEAARHAYSGRLSLEALADGRVRVDYCTGQYFPTEYRRAVAAVLATALWDYMRDQLPAGLEAPGKVMRTGFRREFGRRIQSRYLD